VPLLIQCAVSGGNLFLLLMTFQGVCALDFSEPLTVRGVLDFLVLRFGFQQIANKLGVFLG